MEIIQQANKIERKKTKRIFNGTVFSDKMDKTIIAAVFRTKINLKYKKRYRVTKRYKVHDEHNQYKVGDKVKFEECRPLSKEKKWRVVNLIGLNTKTAVKN